MILTKFYETNHSVHVFKEDITIATISYRTIVIYEVISPPPHFGYTLEYERPSGKPWDHPLFKG